MNWHRLSIVMAAAALLATACGSAPSTSSSADPGGGGTTKYQQALAFSQCVRSHGVPSFPDPQSDGGLLINGNSLGVSQSVVQAAQRACQHLLPSGGQPTAAQRQQAISSALKFSQCMRAHGVPNFPDPKVNGNQIGMIIGRNSGINPSSPQFQAAQRACQSLMPGKGKGGSGQVFGK